MSADDEAERRNEASRWFAVADEDIRVIRACLDLDEPALGAAAYHCQQAAEKLIKGLLVAAGTPFRRTHDIDELAELALPRYQQWQTLLDACRPLTVWSVAFRYPGAEDVPEPTPTVVEIEETIRCLSELRAAARSLTC